MFTSDELFFYQYENLFDPSYTSDEDIESHLIETSEQGRYFSLESFLLAQGVDAL